MKSQIGHVSRVRASVFATIATLAAFTAGCGSDSNANATTPTVSFVTPANLATGVFVNSAVAATFSEPMDQGTITTTTFTLTQGGAPVSGTVAYAGTTAAFTPANDLTASASYVATITTRAKSAGGKALASSYVWSFTTGTVADHTPPTVSSVNPANLVTGVAVNRSINVAFSEAMDPTTITMTTFTLTQGGAAVPGTVAYAVTTANFKPTHTLATDTTYVATVTTLAKDLAGNALASDYVWSFKTGTGADKTPPTVSFVNPVNLAADVAVNSAINAAFSEAMDSNTMNTATFSLMQGSTAVLGTVAYTGTTAIFTPVDVLSAGTPYTATITTLAKDLAGNALASNFVWSFTTGTGTDTVAPTVATVNPADLATGVVVNTAVDAAFSEAMDPLTITAATFTVTQGSTPVSGTVVYTGTTATFTPTVLFASGATFTASITTGVKDLAGNALASAYTWSFITGDVVAMVLPVNLRTAANYVILAKTGISTVPPSVVTGNIAVSPAAASYITGFSLVADASNVFSTATQVTGKVYAANYAPPTPANLTMAVSDMELAFTDAAGRAAGITELGAGNIGGLTLAPGVYKWGTGLLIPTDVTLRGNATDVWIFEIAEDLTMSSGVQVILAGQALAKNVFWQVSGMVELGTTAHCEGIVLTQTAVTLKTGASINGRLLAQTAVNLQSSTVVQP